MNQVPQFAGPLYVPAMRVAKKAKSPAKRVAKKSLAEAKSPAKRRTVKKSPGKAKSPVKKVAGKKSTKSPTYVITLNTFFRRTNNEVKEKNPTQRELNKIVKERVIPEIREYVLDNEIRTGYLPVTSYKNLKAHPKGKITFEVSGASMEDVGRLVQKMNRDSFEDGFYGAFPGTGLVIATKKNPYEELGVIDYRGRIDVHVK